MFALARLNWRHRVALLALLAVAGCTAAPAASPVATAQPTSSARASAKPAGSVTAYRDVAYGPVKPGNLLDLYVPNLPDAVPLPLIIWNSGSGWSLDDVKDQGEELPVVAFFNGRGFAVASISIRSSLYDRFPAQGYDVRAAVRYLRKSAATYGLDPNRFAFMGDSSGGWAAAFAATTGDNLELPGETGVDGTSSAVQAAVAFYPPTDFLSMDAFAKANKLPMSDDAYPHDGPTSREGYLIRCPGEGASSGYAEASRLVSIQACPDAAELADPATYVDGDEAPIWLLHGLDDGVVPYNQSELLYDALVAEGNEARLSLAPARGHHSAQALLSVANTTTSTTDSSGHEMTTAGTGPSWIDIEAFVRAHLD